MSIDNHQMALADLHGRSDDPVVKQSTETANQYTEMLKAGQIQKEEYIELLKDIERTNNINKSVDNQQMLEYVNIVLNGLVTIASAA